MEKNKYYGNTIKTTFGKLKVDDEFTLDKHPELLLFKMSYREDGAANAYTKKKKGENIPWDSVALGPGRKVNLVEGEKNIKKIKKYEYEDDGGRFLCKLHHRLRCSECFYVDVIEKENKKLRETVEFYADKEIYKVNVKDQWQPVFPIQQDGGSKARETLEEIT